MLQSTKAHLALLGTNVFFAINYTVVKYLMNNEFVKSFGLNLVRVGICTLLLWIMYLLSPNKGRIEPKDYKRFFLCALFGIAINQLLFLKGLSLTYSIHASLLMLITPILITIIAAWLLRERLTANKAIGLVLGICGAIVLITARSNSGDGSSVIVGDILIIINAVSYTFYFILVKPLMLKYNPVMVIRMVFTMGFVLIFPFCITQFVAIPWERYTALAYFNLFLLVFFGTFLAYLLNVYGIKYLGASTAGAYIYSQPVFAAIVAIIFLNEDLSLYKIVAAVLIASGVYLSNKKAAHVTV